MAKLLSISAAAVIAAASTFSIITWRHFSSIATTKISSSKTIPDSFSNSKSIKYIVNPRDHTAFKSTRSIELTIPYEVSGEVLLARFVKGFFGGYVLAPERAILNTLRIDMVDYDCRLGRINTCSIWSASQLSEKTLPPLHSKIFGAFQVVDRQLEAGSPGSTKTHSYIDIAFGSDTGYIAGVNRFSVWRDNRDQSNDILIEYSDIAFNPAVDKLLSPRVLLSFHLVYAMLLFREGVSNVLQR